MLTRSLLLYRYRRLPEARSSGGGGRLPTGPCTRGRAGSNGQEESQQLHLNPAVGAVAPGPHPPPAPRGHRHRLQRVAVLPGHRRPRVPVIHYGAEMLLEIARFWGSIASFDRARDRYVIHGVMGPDEFHSGYAAASAAGATASTTTPTPTSWPCGCSCAPSRCSTCSRRRPAPRAARRGWPWRPPRSSSGGDTSASGCSSPSRRWRHQPVRGLRADLEELDWEGYRERYGDIHRLDRILEAEGDSVNRYKASKQADVLMLFYLLSSDELRALLGHHRLRAPSPTRSRARSATTSCAPRTGRRSAPSSTPGCWPAPSASGPWTVLRRARGRRRRRPGRDDRPRGSTSPPWPEASTSCSAASRVSRTAARHAPLLEPLLARGARRPRVLDPVPRASPHRAHLGGVGRGRRRRQPGATDHRRVPGRGGTPRAELPRAVPRRSTDPGLPAMSEAAQCRWSRSSQPASWS
jgi:hypothetical protein